MNIIRQLKRLPNELINNILYAVPQNYIKVSFIDLIIIIKYIEQQSTFDNFLQNIEFNHKKLLKIPNKFYSIDDEKMRDTYKSIKKKFSKLTNKKNFLKRFASEFSKYMDLNYDLEVSDTEGYDGILSMHYTDMLSILINKMFSSCSRTRNFLNNFRDIDLEDLNEADDLEYFYRHIDKYDRKEFIERIEKDFNSYMDLWKWNNGF